MVLRFFDILVKPIWYKSSLQMANRIFSGENDIRLFFEPLPEFGIFLILTANMSPRFAITCSYTDIFLII